MIAINGMGSQIARELLALLPDGEEAVGHHLPGPVNPEADRYVFCQGALYGRSLAEHDPDSAATTLRVNFLQVAEACDAIFAAHSAARVVVIGSMSGACGSYDMAYAGAKAALHLYVETKALKPGQQLVGVAPGIIGDAGMTLRRTDQRDLAIRELQHPKGRWLSSREVAELVRFLLYDDRGYLSGTVIQMHGGGR